MTTIRRTLWLWLISLLMLSGCMSRFRMDLFMTLEEHRYKVGIEDTMLVQDVTIGDPFADAKLVPGAGSVVIVSTSARGEKLDPDFAESLFLGYDENLRCKLYLELPTPIRSDTLELVNRSFVQLLGRYEESADSKIFLANEGQLIIDSVVDNSMFAHLDGQYRNRAEKSLAFQGKFKVKIAN